MVEARQVLTFLFLELIKIVTSKVERINIWDGGKVVSKRHSREIYKATTKLI